MNKEELFLEIECHLMDDKRPSRYLNNCNKYPLFHEDPFLMLEKLKSTKQSPKYHPEGSVWNHTMMVVDEAAKVKMDSSNPKAFMWAALLHDIGKPDTTRLRRGRITSYNHDVKGERLAAEFLSEFSKDDDFIAQTIALVRWHMQILFVSKNLPYQDIKKMKEQVNAKDITLLTWCDRMGRSNADAREELRAIDTFYEIVK